MLVKDHLDKPVDGVQVRLVERQLDTQDQSSNTLSCTESASSQSSGLAIFICNTPRNALKVVLKVRRGGL